MKNSMLLFFFIIFLSFNTSIAAAQNMENLTYKKIKDLNKLTFTAGYQTHQNS